MALKRYKSTFYLSNTPLGAWGNAIFDILEERERK